MMMDQPEDVHENPLHEPSSSTNNKDKKKNNETKQVVVKIHEDSDNNNTNKNDEKRTSAATLRLRTIANVVGKEQASFRNIHNIKRQKTSRAHRRHSTYAAADVSVFAIEGQPHTKMNWNVFWWAFLVHFLYPFGTIYVYLMDGKQCFLNMRLGFKGFMQISFTHILFAFPVICLIWIFCDKSAMDLYGTEILVLWFAHFSRLLGIAVKYSHVNADTLKEFKTCEMAKAEKIQNNMMLPPGWFQPTLEQWFPIVRAAEKHGYEQIGLHSLTMGHGLSSHLTYIGHSAVKQIKELIEPYQDLDEIKKNEWTVLESVKGTMSDDKVPVLEVSAGIILMAFLGSEDMKKAHVTIGRCLLNAVVLSILPSTIGIWYRMGNGLPGGGNHYASGLFIFTIVYCTFWNMWSFFIFLETAVVDYQRRYLLQQKLCDQLKVSLTNDGKFHIMPKLLDLRRGTNGSSYIAIRQVIKYLGKDFRLRLQWIISYSLFMCIMFMLQFFTLVGKVNKTFQSPQWYATFFIITYGDFIVRALYWADKSNSTPAGTELRDFEIQVMQAHVELNSHLMLNTNDDLKQHELEIEKNSISFLRECIRFIVRDDEQSPIKIIGVRADWKLFQGFIATIFAFLLTFVEFVGLEAIGIEGVGGD